jgi:hypothetical protein
MSSSGWSPAPYPFDFGRSALARVLRTGIGSSRLQAPGRIALPASQSTSAVRAFIRQLGRAVLQANTPDHGCGRRRERRRYCARHAPCSLRSADSRKPGQKPLGSLAGRPEVSACGTGWESADHQNRGGSQLALATDEAVKAIPDLDPLPSQSGAAHPIPWYWCAVL